MAETREGYEIQVEDYVWVYIYTYICDFNVNCLPLEP